MALLEKTLSNMHLFRLSYEVPTDIDGTLCWSRVVSSVDLGVFWALGQKKPWGKVEATSADQHFAKLQKAMDSMCRTDPLADVASSTEHRAAKRRAVGERRGGGQGAHNDATLAAHVGAPMPLPPAALEGDGNAPESAAHHGANDAAIDLIMDMLEDEGDDLDEDDILELEAAYGGQPGHSEVVEAEVDADIAMRVPERVSPDGADDQTSSVVAAELADIVGDIGLETEAPVANAGSTSASSNGIAELPAGESEAPPPPPPWRCMEGPSSSGYVYYQGRGVMRIQRDKPPGRLTLSCYRHTRCNMLINLSRAPDDDTLKQWLFEVEPNPPGSTPEERTALARKHLGSARARWTAPQR